MVARAAEQVGGAAVRVDVPDLRDGRLALSGVFLSSAPAADGADETLRDAHARRSFEAGDTLYFQVYVYNLPARANDVVLQAQIWSAGRAVAASRAEPLPAAEPDGRPLLRTSAMSLAGLAPGSYELRVVAAQPASGATVTQRARFTLD
jgi:hypothetical protein